MLFDPATSLVYSTNDDIINQATIDVKGEYGMNYDQFRSKVSKKKTLWAPLNVNDFQPDHVQNHAWHTTFGVTQEKIARTAQQNARGKWKC